MRLRVRSLPLLSGLGIWCCRELWCRLLGSRLAVALAQAGGYSSDLTPSLGTSICLGSSPRNSKKTKRQKKKNPWQKNRYTGVKNWEHWSNLLQDAWPPVSLYADQLPPLLLYTTLYNTSSLWQESCLCLLQYFWYTDCLFSSLLSS